MYIYTYNRYIIYIIHIYIYIHIYNTYIIYIIHIYIYIWASIVYSISIHEIPWFSMSLRTWDLFLSCRLPRPPSSPVPQRSRSGSPRRRSGFSHVCCDISYHIYVYGYVYQYHIYIYTYMCDKTSYFSNVLCFIMMLTKDL